jgi:hypothetical protein
VLLYESVREAAIDSALAKTRLADIALRVLGEHGNQLRRAGGM